MNPAAVARKQDCAVFGKALMCHLRRPGNPAWQWQVEVADKRKVAMKVPFGGFSPIRPKPQERPKHPDLLGDEDEGRVMFKEARRGLLQKPGNAKERQSEQANRHPRNH